MFPSQKKVKKREKKFRSKICFQNVQAWISNSITALKFIVNEFANFFWRGFYFFSKEEFLAELLRANHHMFISIHAFIPADSTFLIKRCWTKYRLPSTILQSIFANQPGAGRCLLRACFIFHLKLYW